MEILEREIGRFCREMWHSPERGRLLLVAGPNGTAKTHCAKSVNHWVWCCGHGCQFVPEVNVVTYLRGLGYQWSVLLDKLKSNWNLAHALMQELFTVPCLVIDDIGAEHDPSSVGVDKLCQILSAREDRWTLITTNILPEEWEQKFDRRIASRFLRNSTIVELAGVPDYNQ